MNKTIVVIGWWVKSINDGDLHYISPRKLCDLYNIPPNHPRVKLIGGGAIDREIWLKEITRNPDAYLVLRPKRRSEGYKLSPELKKEIDEILGYKKRGVDKNDLRY